MLLAVVSMASAPTRHPPSIMQQPYRKAMYIEAPPPVGFVWAELHADDMEGKVTSTSSVTSATPVESTTATVPVPIEMPPPAACITSSKIEESQNVALVKGKSIVLPFCMITTFLGTGSIDVACRFAYASSLLGAGPIAVVSLLLKLGWRLCLASALYCAFHARLLASN